MAVFARESISVVFPAYNEAENIEKVVEQAIDCLERLFQDWEVIIVDDGSKDGTGEIIDKLAQRDSRVAALHHHDGNRGYGAALKSGIERARKELIFFCDSDLQFHLNELLLLLMWVEQYDAVIGYRSQRSDSFHRKLNAQGWKILVRLLLGLKVRDIDCAFKLFRRSVFHAIKIDAVGAMVNTDILVQAQRMEFRIKEIPITHFPRLAGKQTGANLLVVIKAFKELLRLYSKLRNIHPIVFPYDRRQRQNGSGSQSPLANRRKTDRRRVMLPINFSDRRRRVIRVFATESPDSNAV